MAPDHDHGDGHAGHAHGVSANADTGKLTIALGLIVAFMCVEVVVGILASSLALLSDAGHMLTDAAALGLSIVAVRLAQRPAKGALTYGLKRTEILSAQFNGVTLLLLALLIIYESITRLVSPPTVAGTAVLVVALIGIVVNLAATYTLSQANRQSMNVEGSFQHPHRPVRVHRDRDRRRGDPGHRVRARGRDRVAGHRRDHAPRRLRTATRLRPGVPGSRPARP